MISKIYKQNAIQFIATILWPILCFFLGGLSTFCIVLLIQNSGIVLDINSTLVRCIMTTVSVTVALFLLIQLPTILKIKLLYSRSLALNKFKLKYTITILVFVFLIFALNQISDALAELLKLSFDNDRNAASLRAVNLIELAGNLFIAGVLTAVLEEVMYRGYIYGNLKAVTNMVTAFIMSSLIFALMHFDIVYLPFLLLFSLLLCYLREKTQSIIPGIIVHALSNSIVILFMYLGHS